MNAPDTQPASVEHVEELKRLKKTLKRARWFNLIVIEYNDQSLRREVFDEIKELGHFSFAQLDLSPVNLPSVSLFEDNLRHLAQDFTVIHLYNLESYTSEDDRRAFLQQINLHRERIADTAQVNILFWVLEYQVKELMTQAPDFWAWNSAVIRFHSEKEGIKLEALPEDHAIAELNMPETRHRIESLMDFFTRKDLSTLNEAERALLLELVRYHKNIIDYECFYGFLDQSLTEIKNELEKKFIADYTYVDGSTDEEKKDDLQKEISFLADQLSVKPGGNRLEKVRCIQPAVSALNQTNEDTVETGRLSNNLALIYMNMGDLKQALVYAQKAVAISEKNLPSDHLSLATSYNNLALIYKNMGDLEQALVYAQKAVAIIEKNLPSDHPSLATSYNNLALIYRDMGDLDQALFYTKKAVAIFDKTLPSDHPDLATSYNNLAMIYQDMGDLEQALVYVKKAVAISEKILPSDHPELATSYHNIATVY